MTRWNLARIWELQAVSISLIFALTRPPRALLPRGPRSTSPRTRPLKERASHARPVERRRAKKRLPWPTYAMDRPCQRASYLGLLLPFAAGPGQAGSAAWPGVYFKVGQLSLSNLPRYSAFLEFFCKGTQGAPCGCSRSLSERSLKYRRYPSYTSINK